MQEELEVAQRRACRVLGQPRSTQRYTPRDPERDRALVQRMLELVRRHPRYGYRRITALLRQEGWPVNRKRIYRLWRQEGLKVPQKQRKKRRWGSSANGVLRRRPAHPDHVWCYDFLKDQTTDGRLLKLLPIEDEYTRECLALDVARSITAQDVIRTLASLFAERGAPRFIRSDNGPEFIAQMAEAKAMIDRLAPDLSWIQTHAEEATRFAREIEAMAARFSSPFEKYVLHDRTWTYFQKMAEDHARMIAWAERGRTDHKGAARNVECVN